METKVQIGQERNFPEEDLLTNTLDQTYTDMDGNDELAWNTWTRRRGLGLETMRGLDGLLWVVPVSEYEADRLRTATEDIPYDPHARRVERLVRRNMTGNALLAKYAALEGRLRIQVEVGIVVYDATSYVYEMVYTVGYMVPSWQADVECVVVSEHVGYSPDECE